MSNPSNRQSSGPDRRFAVAPLKIAGIYAIVSAVWIRFSDALVLRIFEGPALYSSVQTIKGWAFVLCTSIMIYLLVRRYLSGLNKEISTRRTVEADLHEQKRALSTLISNLPGMVYRCRNDRAWTMEIVSDGCRELCGCDPDELIGNARFSYGRDIVHPDDQEPVWRSVQKALEERRPFRIAYRIIARNQKTKMVWEQGRGVFSREGELLAVEGFIADITELRDTKIELKKLTQAVEQNASAILILDSKGVVEYANPSFTTLTGYARHVALDRRLDALPGPAWKSGDLERLLDLVERGDAWRGEIKIKRADGKAIWTQVAFSSLQTDGAGPTHYLLMMDDVSERKHYEKQLIRHAHFDDLTGLPNRVLATDRLTQGVRSALASQTSLAVFLVNVDNIARLNETLGHEAGDEVLRETARRLVAAANKQDTVARIGSDEFLVLSPDPSSAKQPEALAYKLLDQVRRPYFINRELVSVTASLGVCLAPDDAEDAHEILLNVLAATKRARDAGGDRIRFFAPELDAEARSRIKQEKLIRRGLSESRFSVAYQPIVDLKSGRIAAAEALIRLNDPDEGAVRPDEFIPVAEESGLIAEIGRFVLKEACITAKRCAQKWNDLDFTVAVNVSARELGSESYAETVADILERADLSPRNLELEITERAFLQDTDESRSVIARLQALGVRLAIDDFGTGQASIAYLRKFPFEKLKLDRSYVSKASGDAEGRTLGSAILALARELDLRVVGEGVETEDEAIWLRYKGCDFGQGYFFSRALARDEILKLPETMNAGGLWSAQQTDTPPNILDKHLPRSAGGR